MMLNKRLIDLMGADKKFVGWTILFKWGALLTNVGLLFIFSFVIDNFDFFEPRLWRNILLAFGGILLFRFLFNYFSVYFAGKVSRMAKIILRNKVYDKILRIHGGFGGDVDTMEVLQNATEGIESLENYFGRYLPQFFYALIAPVTLFFVTAFVSLKVAVLFIVCVPLIPLSIMLFMKIAKKIMKDYWGAYVDLGGTFLENLRGLTTLKLFEVADVAHEEMDEEAESFRKMTMRLLGMQLNSVTIMDLVAYGGAAAGILVALFELRAGAISVGEFVFVVLIAAEFFIPLRLLGSFFHVAMTSVTASEKIFDLLAIEEPFFGDRVLGEIDTLEMQGVDFAYDEREMILSGLNFVIRKGDSVAFVGDSGSGKSTLANLLMGLRKPLHGNVLVNGEAIDCYSFEDLMKRITLISTNSPVFGMTIRENLLIANPNATEEELFEVLEKAQLLKEVLGFPLGLDTGVGQQGSELSGGQKQRLAIARALLADREVLIFDEATSNIDSESEELIWKVIEGLSGRKTLIVISHRLEAVRFVDRIFLLGGGGILEEGKHEALMVNDGRYAAMVRMQKELESYRGGF